MQVVTRSAFVSGRLLWCFPCFDDSEHYENLPMQYTENFSEAKIENFIGKKWIVLIFSLKTYIVGTR